MRRKVIRQGHNTLTVTLPKKWCDSNGINSGSEIGLEYSSECLSIFPSEHVSKLSAKMDISNLDRCSILYTIRNLYRIGYDEIELSFNTRTTKYHRLGETLPVIDVVKYELSNLVGLEIIEQGSSRILIKDISNTAADDFDQLLKRIFLLIHECGDDVISNLKKFDSADVASIKEKHDIITKFVSYCLRSLNKSRVSSCKRKELFYHILSSLDKIADVYKNTSRDMVYFKPKVGERVFSYTKDIVQSIRLYEKLFYKLEQTTMSKINEIRDNLRADIRKSISSFSKVEIIFITGMMHILEQIADMVVTRMGMEI